MKRLFDIVVSAIALAVLAPLLLLAAALIAIETGRPILFVQTRVGRLGRPYTIYKFRSMRANASGPHYTNPNDERITAVGRLLRRTSIDELPQLFNVLAGDMSLVGPRPLLPKHKELYAPADWDARHHVRPGITGLAQALYRSLGSRQQRLEADLKYAAAMGPWQRLALDVKIVLLTLKRLGGSGSN